MNKTYTIIQLRYTIKQFLVNLIIKNITELKKYKAVRHRILSSAVMSWNSWEYT